MSTAGIAAQEIQVSLKNGYLHRGQGLGSPKECWPGTNEFEDAYYSLDPLAMAYDLTSAAPRQITSFGHISKPFAINGHCCAENCMKAQSKKSSPLPLQLLPNYEEDQVVPSFKKLSVNGCSSSDKTPPHTPTKSGPPLFQAIVSHERGCRPLPPLPISEDHSIDDADSEVEFITSSETDYLIDDCRPLAFKYGVPSRRSFRGCGQINYAYFDSVTGSKKVDHQIPNQERSVQCTKPQKPEQPNRRLRRSHSGPAGSYNKPARLSSHLNRASPNSDEDKPEIPPRIPIPPRPVKPDYRRWSAEVTSNTYSDEDRPPKVPPREPLSRSNSRTPSPKSLPLYLNGVMPPTQSFAPDPKYVSSKALQRQHSEGSTNKIPCILPIIENGKKASSTHYYLLPERPAYLHRYEKYFTEAEEASSDTKAQSWPNDCTTAAAKLDSKAKTDLVNHAKCKHLSYVVSP